MLYESIKNQEKRKKRKMIRKKISKKRKNEAKIAKTKIFFLILSFYGLRIPIANHIKNLIKK
jgi:hypothetical protein